MKHIFVFSTVMSLLLSQQADIYGLAPFHANKTLVDLAGEARGRLAGRDIDKECLQDMAVWELLKVLGLHDQKEIAALTLATRQMENGYRLVKIRMPEQSSISSHLQGLEILHNELVQVTSYLPGNGKFFERRDTITQTRKFYLLYNPNDHLIAILPVVPGFEDEQDYYHHVNIFDLSGYYIPVRMLQNPGSADEWTELFKHWEKDQDAIKAVLHVIYEEVSGVRQAATPFSPFGLEFKTKKGWPLRVENQFPYMYFPPFACVTVPPKAPGRPGKRFNVKSKIFQPFEFEEFLRWVSKPPEGSIMLPLYPTVYKPDHLSNDETYYSAVYPGWKNLRFSPDDTVLIIGPGTGMDIWLASHRIGPRNKLYAVGLNPLEIAATKTTARIAGFEVVTAVQNHLIDNPGSSPFNTGEYQWVLWNMPIYGGMNPVSGHKFSYRRLWDRDMEGRRLREFLGELKKYLAPGGKAVLWNSFQSEVHQILMEEGFYFQVFQDNKGTAVYVVSLPTEGHSTKAVLDMGRGTLELERSL